MVVGRYTYPVVFVEELEAGIDPTIVHARLLEQARSRRGQDADRYASRTVARALRGRFAPPPPTRDPREI